MLLLISEHVAWQVMLLLYICVVAAVAEARRGTASNHELGHKRRYGDCHGHVLCSHRPHSYSFSFFNSVSLVCSMITQRFRKQGRCKYLDQREEGSKVKSGSELSDGAYAFPAMRRAPQWMLFFCAAVSSSVSIGT